MSDETQSGRTSLKLMTGHHDVTRRPEAVASLFGSLSFGLVGKKSE